MGFFFFVAKLVWSVLAPSQLFQWLALALVIALFARRERIARGLAIALVAVFIVFGVLPVGVWLARPLENQYPRPAPAPARVDGILVLGGGLGDRIIVARHALAAEASDARVISAFALSRQYPAARVVFSGGWGRFPDAAAAQVLFTQMGLDPTRLTLEPNSHDTFENLQLSRALAQPKPGEVWLLATSAIQMPRAMAVAKKLGWPLTPWPTDYLTTPRPGRFQVQDLFDIGGHFGRADQATHEWLGLLAYRMRGRAA